MRLNRYASATWAGAIRDGTGSVSTDSGALKQYPYSFSGGSGDKVDSNFDELLGAAHAVCFAMAMAVVLAEKKLTAQRLDVQARVTLAQEEESDYQITAVHLTLSANVRDLDQATLEQLAARALKQCPTSKALNTELSVEATLAT